MTPKKRYPNAQLHGWRALLSGGLRSALTAPLLLLISMAVFVLPSNASADEACLEVINESLPASGCNRVFSVHVLAADFVEQWRSQQPPPGHRWLALTVRFDNWMPSDLVFGLSYLEAVLVASLERQLYLLVNDKQVVRARVEDAQREDEFTLPRVGSQQERRVAFAVPEDELTRLSLRYYHDQFAPIRISWLAEPESPGELRAAAMHSAEHDLMALGVQSFALHDTWHDVDAPDGMQWLVVDVRGQGQWRTQVDARARDVQADVDSKEELARVMEYAQAPGLLLAVVDAEHSYVRNTRLSQLEDIPALLPDAWAGGYVVFPVPAQPDRIELVAYMPQFQGADISSEIRPALRFVLQEGSDEPVVPHEPVAQIDDSPIRVTIHSLQAVDTFAEYISEGSGRLIQMDVSMSNSSETGGMMSASARFSLTQPAGELLAAYLRGPMAMPEPFWLPANDQPHRFTLLYRVDPESDNVVFEYGGVSVIESIELSIQN